MRVRKSAVACIVLVHLTALAPAVVHAQALPSLHSVSVNYATRKTTVRPQGEMLAQINAIDAEIAQARQFGRTGELRRLYAMGVRVLNGLEWTPEFEFARSLVLRTDRVIVDPETTWSVRVEQIFQPTIQLERPLVAHTVLRRPAVGAGAQPEVVRDFGTRDGVARDLRESPLELDLDLAGVADGSYQAVVTLRDGERTLGAVTLPIVVRSGVDAQAALLRREAARAPESVRADILYPVERMRLVNRGVHELRTFNPVRDFARADSVMRAATSGRDPFAQRTGDFKRHYVLASAGEIMPYRLYVPTTYTATKKYPVVVMLHGLGGTEDGLFDGYQGRPQQLAEQHGYILVAPLGYRVDGWYGWTAALPPGDPEALRAAQHSEEDVMAVLEQVRRSYAVDSTRVYLMGHSMGAIGTWHLGPKYPQLWAALAPIAGIGNPALLERITHIPQIVVHGDADATVNVQNSRTMVARMRQLGITVNYIEVAGGDHVNIAVPNLPAIFEFFNVHRRQ